MSEQNPPQKIPQRIVDRRTKPKEDATTNPAAPQPNPEEEAKKNAIGHHLQLLANLCGEYANSLPQATGSLVRAGSNNSVMAIARLVGIEAKERE